MIGADGRSKGCGLVSFASAHDAATAIQTLHDSVLHTRSIFVREDREPSTALGSPAGGFGGGKGGGRGGGGGGLQPAAGNGCQVFVGNLPWDVAWQALKDHFRAAGGSFPASPASHIVADCPSLTCVAHHCPSLPLPFADCH